MINVDEAVRIAQLAIKSKATLSELNQLYNYVVMIRDQEQHASELLDDILKDMQCNDDYPSLATKEQAG